MVGWVAGLGVLPPIGYAYPPTGRHRIYDLALKQGPPERIDVPSGGVVRIGGGTPLQTANHGAEDLVVFASGYPGDEGATLLESAVA